MVAYSPSVRGRFRLDFATAKTFGSAFGGFFSSRLTYVLVLRISPDLLRLVAPPPSV